MGSEKIQIKEYDCLRVIATLLVVMGHCTYTKINTNFGGCDYSDVFDCSGMVSVLLVELTNIIYIFHMPLFMGLSGALFFYSISYGKYNNMTEIIVSKWKRLMIPFLAISFFYSVPLKYVSGYYRKSFNVVLDVLIGQIFLQGNSHLWYCVALFNIFVVAFAIERKIYISKNLKIILLLIIYLLGSGMKINIVKYTFQNLIWFYLGYWFEPQREIINGKIDCKRIVKALGMFLVMYIIYKVLLGRDEGIFFKLFCKFWKIIVIILACLIFYAIAYKLSRTSIVENKIYCNIRADSFGIYLYSDPWNYVMLLIAGTLLSNSASAFGNELGFFLLYIFRFVCTLGISVWITEVVKKLKINYLY